MFKGKAQKGGLALFALGVLDRVLDRLAIAGGIHADSPRLFEWAWGMISDAFAFLGFSGIAIIVGAGMFIWGRWGRHIRKWLPSLTSISPEPALATHDDLAKLVHAIADSSDFASELADKSSEIAIKEAQIMLLRDVTPQINDLRQQLNDTHTQRAQTIGDLNVLLYYALYDLNLRTLRDLLSSAPLLELYYERGEVTADWLREQKVMADEFVERTERSLRYTPRHDPFISVLQNAESEADHEVRQIPAERRPLDVNPFDLRTYAISTHKCRRAKEFLERQEREMVERTASQRSSIQERFDLRNP